MPQLSLIIEFEGNIKDHYDPYNFAGVMEDYSSDFNYYDDNSTFGQRPDTWNFKKAPKKGEKDE